MLSCCYRTLMRSSEEESTVSKRAASLLLAVFLIAACGSGSDSAASLDQQYIDMMVPHHESAVLIGIRFSSVAGERPTNPLRGGGSVRLM